MFPVRASNEAAADDAIAGLEFIPLSTWGGQRSELILQYCQTTGPTTYLLTRMDEISLLALLEEISVVGTSQGLRISWSRLGPGQSFVQGIKLTCLAGEADKADKLEEHSQD
jgi:hypothetical protein